MLRNLFLAGTRRFDDLQAVSEGFWRNSSYTFLASPEYYARRTEVLGSILDSLGDIGSAVDIGCGDGQFTRMLASQVRSTVGYDISPSLITTARRDLPKSLAGKVRFEIAALDDIPESGQYDLVACMGVLSCLLHDATYLQTVAKCRNLTRPGGHLLLVDTVADGREIVRAYRSGYVARYRNRNDYERAILDHGMSIEAARLIARMSPRTNNLLYLARRQHHPTSS